MERLNWRTHQDWNNTANLVSKRRAVENQSFTNEIPDFYLTSLCQVCMSKQCTPAQVSSSPYFTISFNRGLEGSNIYQSLHEFLQQSARDRKGACVCLCSDGLKENWMFFRQLQPHCSHRNGTARTSSFTETNWWQNKSSFPQLLSMATACICWVRWGKDDIFSSERVHWKRVLSCVPKGEALQLKLPYARWKLLEREVLVYSTEHHCSFPPRTLGRSQSNSRWQKDGLVRPDPWSHSALKDEKRKWKLVCIKYML